MRNVLLFILLLMGGLWAYDYYDCRTVKARVIAKAQIREIQEAAGKKVYMAEYFGEQVRVVHVLSKNGFWVRPIKDSTVTSFVTADVVQPQFMSGNVKSADIEMAFHKQRRLVLGMIGLIVLAFLASWYEPDSDSGKKISEK